MSTSRLHLPRNGDAVLKAMARQVERFYNRNRRIPQRPGHNQFRHPLQIEGVALTHLDSGGAEISSHNGGMVGSAHLESSYVHSFVRVGTSMETGVGYASRFAPLRGDIRSLERIARLAIQDAVGIARDHYFEVQRDLNRDEDAFPYVPAKVEAVCDFDGKVRRRRTPHGKLETLAKESSRIVMDEGKNDAEVTFRVSEEIRRLVTSEGTVIRDSFYGYRVLLSARTKDTEGREMEFNQSLYATDRFPLTEEKVRSTARWMREEINKRRDCPVIESQGTYPVLLSPAAMATQLHECFVHLLAADNIIKFGSTVWGWENFGKQVAHPHISVFADPGMPGRWGSILYDAEGVPAQRRALLEQGRVVGYLATRDQARFLSEKVRQTILPGDARFVLEESMGDAYPIQPRLTNFEVVSTFDHEPPTQAALEREFVHYLRREGKEYGIVIVDGSGAASYLDGRIEAFPNFMYRIDQRGRKTPVKFGVTYADAQAFVDRIVTMGGRTTYVPHRCGDGGEEGDDRYNGGESIVSVGIMCKGGFVSEMAVRPDRRERLRQYRK